MNVSHRQFIIILSSFWDYKRVASYNRYISLMPPYFHHKAFSFLLIHNIKILIKLRQKLLQNLSERDPTDYHICGKLLTLLRNVTLRPFPFRTPSAHATHNQKTKSFRFVLIMIMMIIQHAKRIHLARMSSQNWQVGLLSAV